MKRFLIFLFAVLFIPSKGISQLAGSMSPGIHTSVLSIDANLAFGPSSSATWDPSLGFRLQVNDKVRVGIGYVSFGSADVASGTRYAIMGGPVVEYIAL